MSEQRNDGGPAFPAPMSQQTASNQDCAPYQGGMSLRDWFAGQALAGLLANSSTLERGFTVDGGNRMTTTELCYYTADAMLTARQTKGTIQ